MEEVCEAARGQRHASVSGSAAPVQPGKREPLGRAVRGSVEEGGLAWELAPCPPRHSAWAGQLSGQEGMWSDSCFRK